MGAAGGFALKLVQWTFRAIEFGCCVVVLGLYSYFLATMSNHQLPISVHVRAIEGISGVGVIYTAAALLLLCCLAGHPVTSLISIILDAAFAAGFIYIAIENSGGAGSCNGVVNTWFGTGDSNARPTGADGFTNLPLFHTACQMETASLAVAVIAIFFFIFSILMEVVLVRHRRKENAFGPSPANNYTSGYGKRRGGFFSRFGRRSRKNTTDPNVLPEHTHPAQVRDSYATESTAVGHQPMDHTKHEHGLAHENYDGRTAYPNGNHV